MTKADIVNEIAKNTGIDKATVLATLEAFTVKVTVTVLPKRSVAVRVWTPSAAETVSLPSTSSTGWPLRVTLSRLGSVTAISAVRQ